MKKIATIILVLIAWASLPVYAHKEWVHQHMVQQAYLMLENQIGPIPLLRNSVGIDWQGRGNFRGEGDPLFLNFPQIVGGAWREDSDDWAYGNNGGPNGGVTPSITHFWSADKGDDVRTVNNGFTYYQNAWEKARVYLFCQDRDGRRDVTVPYNNGNGFKSYHLYYTSLIDFYKGTYTLDYITDLDGSNRVDYQITRTNPSFTQPFALQILGRVAHLLGDMSVPAHVHSHLHPCPAGLPDYYENQMGGVWYQNNSVFSCEADPGGSFPAQQWTAATAAQTGGLVQEMYCQGNDMAKMRYLFYTNNQLADFFPSGVNPTGIRDADYQNAGPSNNNYLVGGNPDLPNGPNSYVTSRYAVYSQPPTLIAYKAVANETFNYSIRAVATLFQWFAFNTGIIQDLKNTSISSGNNKFSFCAGGQYLDLQLTTLPPNTTVYWSVQPSGLASGTITGINPPNFHVTPTSDQSSGAITVSASFTQLYGPSNCYAIPVTLTTTLWKGLPNSSIQYREPTGDADLEPGASIDLIAQTEQERIQGPMTYNWFTYDPDVYLYANSGAASVQAPRDNSHFFTIYATVNNACGSVTVSRNFRTKDPRPPGDDCLVCPSVVGKHPTVTDDGSTTAPAIALAPGCYTSPNPSDKGFDLYYVRAVQQFSKVVANIPTFTLFDVLGRRISKGVLTTSITHFDTSTLQEGLYLLHIEDNGTSIYKRVQTKH